MAVEAACAKRTYPVAVARVARVLVALSLCAVALWAGLAAWGVLQNLWADYQDSTTSTYLLFGLPLLALSLAALVSAIAVLRKH